MGPGRGIAEVKRRQRTARAARRSHVKEFGLFTLRVVGSQGRLVSSNAMVRPTVLEGPSIWGLDDEPTGARLEVGAPR